MTKNTLFKIFIIVAPLCFIIYMIFFHSSKTLSVIDDLSWPDTDVEIIEYMNKNNLFCWGNNLYKDYLEEMGDVEYLLIKKY